VSWITRRSAILLLLLGLAVGPAAARPGDVAPPGAPDGRLTVEDALLTLRMTVGLEPMRGGAETAPFVPFGPHSMVVPDGRVDVADTLSTLRGVVGLHETRRDRTRTSSATRCAAWRRWWACSTPKAGGTTSRWAA
jgi:hypothetical protein